MTRLRLAELIPRKRWKILLMLGAVLISVFFLLFTNYLVEELSRKELQEVAKIADAFEKVDDENVENLTEVLRVIQSATIPIIVADKDENIINSKNLDSSRTSDTAYLKSQLRQMRFYNDPIAIKYDEHSYHYVYYKEQRAITLLRYFPYVQLALIGLFLFISYLAFNTSTRYEQNKVWVGMAKETAHQIGTPLSSLIAWVEYLRTTGEAPGEEILQEIEMDIKRLEVITERFSKIGSVPEFQPYNVVEVLQESIDYLQKRIPGTVQLSLTKPGDEEATAMLNKNLFSWVIENLVKNAVDAMQGRGSIWFSISVEKKAVNIDVKDTGKGIPAHNFKTVFEPGFTTRKRGWGLGLSLSRRIIENYHEGSIFVKESEVGQGTTFRIRLEKGTGTK